MSKDLMKQMVLTREGRRALSIASPIFFAKYYMGMDYLEHQNRWVSKAKYLMDQATVNMSKEKLLVLAPRGHGKSYLSLILMVWKLVTNRDTTILIVSATAGQAEKRLKTVRQYLEDRKIIDDWASDDLLPFRDESTSWLNNRLYLKRDGKIIDPSIEAIGIGGAVTGAHVDFIILDDIEDSITANSEALRRRSTEWLGGTLMPILNRGGLLLTIGTRKGTNDLYGKMLKDPTTTAIVDSAIVKFPRNYEFVYEHVAGRDIIKDIIVEGEDEAEVLWPEERPLRFLLTELATVGTKMFYREMQNQPTSDDDAIFKTEWVGRALDLGAEYSVGVLPPGYDTLVVGVDLALNTDPDKSKKADSDYTVLTAVAVDKSGNRFIVNMDRFRGVSPDEMYQRIMNFCNLLPKRPREVRIERNNFGALHALALKGRSDLPLREHQTTKNSKAEGIGRLAVLLENAKIVIPSKTAADQDKFKWLVDELNTYPFGSHDDTVLSLSIAEHAVKSATFQYHIYMGDEQESGENEVKVYELEAESAGLADMWGDLKEGWD